MELLKQSVTQLAVHTHSRMRPTVKGLVRALNDTGRYAYKSPELAVDHLVVGGGVVGLAVAQRLSEQMPSKSTYLVERHRGPGEETSSRNSEVIHSGLYYPPQSLKTRLCLRGRDLMYERCKVNNVPFRQTGKLVVARADQRTYVENLHLKSLKTIWPSRPGEPERLEHAVPTQLLSGDQARELEPDLSKDIVAALWCPKTGIVDSHSFMQSLEKDIVESDNAELVYSSTAVRIDPCSSEPGWVVQLQSQDSTTTSVLARTLINASGLSSTLILNSILPQDKRIPIYYARGSYASYHGSGVSQVSHLIYPCPETGPNVHGFESLGTHLTLDLQGKIRFGPDIEWLSPPEPSHGEDALDFWADWLVPSGSRVEEMYAAVTMYLPNISISGLQPDYVGIRPKLIPPGGGFQDFMLRKDYHPKGQNAMISLLGIESPGLTSSLAIAEMVADEVAAEKPE